MAIEGIETRPLRDRQTWGSWIFHLETLTLEDIDTGYEIDLETCTSSAKVLDWIFQVYKKTWCREAGVGDLIAAFDDLLDPQATLCSFGSDKQWLPGSIKTYLQRRVAE